ncbi:DUF4435 domain-containing protein [Clostridium botulinum]|uniref:DUF4435 domain-containing protein n=1 Tax=Clostridium botulinum TaxID=1491 RepID=UPI001967BC17|nr:DUF4435 domain-containing protein [Clostridium botulinum]MBN1076095.1 DUF4435 domain-containing protein [Clostridium botulinum]
MASLHYSKNANNKLNKFHKCSYIIWVEGQDDRIFWNEIFKKFNVSNYHIKDAGGKKNLKNYIDSIVNENADIIVACDKDYDEILKTIKYNNKIIYTYGHSIENTMYCPKTISKVIEKYSRHISNYEKKVGKWYEELEKVCEKLVIYELANEKFRKETCVMGDASARFMEKNTDRIISTNKVEERINDIKDHFEENEIEECSIILKDNKDINLRYLIRGHFISTIAINLIKYYSLKQRESSIRITIDNLFVDTVSGCSNCTALCNDSEYLKNQIIKAFAIKEDQYIAI